MDEEGLIAVLDEMKAQGISGAILRKDGILIHSTFAVTDTGAGLLASVANTADALVQKSKDKAQETEIAFGNLILIILPLNDFLFCGAIKSREEKPALRQFAEKAKKLL